MQRLVQRVCFLVLTLALATSARAQDTYVVHGTQVVEQAPVYRAVRTRPERPSVFTYSYQGFIAGALAGLGAGYLVARPDGVQGDDWRALAFGSGVGALTGASLGITLGLLDHAGARSGYYVARDMSYGVGIGVLLGATAGGLSAILSDDAEHLLLGSAIGSLVGVGLGIVTGVLEGSLRYDPPRGYGALRIRVTAARATLSQSFVPAVVGSF